MIKGGFYGKLLKQSFIILLISCFTLLVNSSVKAEMTCDGNYSCYDIDFGDGIYRDDGGLAGTVEDNNFNFAFNYFSWSSVRSNNLERRLTYWWQSDGLYYTSRYWNLSSPKNGKINGFYVCSQRPYMQTAYRTLASANFCTYKEGFSELNTYLEGTNKYTISCSSSNNYTNCIICLIQETQGNYICIDNGNTSNNDNDFLEITQIETLSTRNPYSNNSSNPGTSFIPSTGSRLGGRLITSSGYTNSQMVEAYECLGLHPSLCYGGFPITNIFQPGEQFEDFTGYIAGEGASVFDLYNLYSGSFSSLNQFLNTVLIRYQNGQINSFITEPKALLMLGSQMNVAGLKTSYISTYCDLLLNKNNDSIYTGNSVDDLRAQSCRRSQKINDSLINSEGEDIVGQGSNVGIFGSGDDVDFDPETFFSNILGRVESGLDKISVGTAVGIVPGYIILFTLALIFIRMISH